MQYPAAAVEGLSGPLSGVYTLPAFKFQPRRESIDWRRISAVDVDRVARELDVATLQENIAGVTFCNLDREVCNHCRQPVDPVLLKVLRLAQLIIEYLLHCQDCLSASVAQLEARLQASLGQQQRGQQELGRQADELKGVREESRRRRKMISTLQQLLLQTGAHSYHTCHLCDKTFMNATFLRGHIQRRHAGAAEVGKQKQEQPLVEVLEDLRAKLQWTQGELEAQREAERQRQVQEIEMARQREIEARKKFDEWKEKERSKLYGEIDKLKQLFWDEFKTVANQNSTLEEKLKVLQTYSMTESHLGSLRDEESEERLKQAQELQALREKMEVQMREENERLHATLSQDQKKAAAQSQHHINALRAQLQEQAKLIASQEEMIQTLSLRKAEEVQKVPKAVDSEEESSEEELQSSHDEQRKVLAALRQNPTWLKQFRPILEDTLEEKLEGMGIKRDTKGISAQTLRQLESLLRTQREQTARSFREFRSLREKLNKEVTSRVKQRWESTSGGSQPEGQPPVKSQRTTLATREAQPKTRTPSVVLPSKPAEPSTPARPSHSSHGPGLPQVSTPIPRPRVHGPSSTPVSPGPGLSSTPPFSSEEEPEEDVVQRVSLQPPKVLSRSAPKPEDNWGWSDSETSEESAQPSGKGSGGLASSGTLVQSMVKNLEKQLETPVKKPSGGVSMFLRPNAALQRSSTPARKSQLSEDESDLEISSLEDLSQDLDQRGKPKPLSQSKLPEKLDASPWSSGRPWVPGW
ncbi:cilium assembly protein DZIP1L isoform X3 [Alexandromys fortis]|uniref:cilium assembly protein DZIP1L isoform X3 n=1 Tax=Alexandromys fortis TaxID=100897 RepID=UPI002152A930|nr:cilium assembly protein DZIP1L isoform X3 [Microtus fortis]